MLVLVLVLKKAKPQKAWFSVFAMQKPACATRNSKLPHLPPRACGALSNDFEKTVVGSH
jgi:hypothetical protein